MGKRCSKPVSLSQDESLDEPVISEFISPMVMETFAVFYEVITTTTTEPVTPPHTNRVYFLNHHSKMSFYPNYSPYLQYTGNI